MNRRGFLGILAGAMLAVATSIPVLEPIVSPVADDWNETIVMHLNLMLQDPWRVGTLRGFLDDFKTA